MDKEGFAEVNTPFILSILMVLMTQVGYLDMMNPWTYREETLDESNDVLETDGSGSSFPYSNDKVSAAGYHTCAILDNGDLNCWGYDGLGQLGDGGDNVDTNAPSSTAVDLGTGRTAVAVSGGSLHTCAILDNGDLKCWGYDGAGQLGDGGNNTNLNTPSSTAIDLGTGRTAVAVSARDYHTCAILDNGDLKCWGNDDVGQLGDGGDNMDTNAPSSTPIDLGIGRTAVAVSTGPYNTCAILDNGELKCWGMDLSGQLGDGGDNMDTNAPSSTPIDLGIGRTAVAVSVGTWHTCAILDNGELKCWGGDMEGQLGDGGGNEETNSPSSTAIDLGTGRTAVAVSAGLGHTCAILDNGDLKCWGLDSYGQLGNGGNNTELNAPSSTAIDLGTGRTAVAVSAGLGHTCAILDNGDAKCWGTDAYGQLGNGGTSSVDQQLPVAVSGSKTWDFSTESSSGSGNQTNTGCGYEASWFNLTNWFSPMPAYGGDTLNVTVATNCNLLGNSMAVYYEISNSTTTLSNGNWSWAATNLSNNYSFEVASIPAGIYELTLDAYYASNSTFLMTNTNDITVLTHNIGGGNETGGNNTGTNTTNPTMNSPPVVSDVTIKPLLPTDADTLTCSYNVYDAEGDSVSVVVHWEVNGNVILVGSANLTSGFSEGDEVECLVTAYDGQMSGNSSHSDMLTILPSTVEDAIEAGNGLPALNIAGTLAAISFAVGLFRRKDNLSLYD